MNEFDLLRKKTGMTIAKAWMLMLSGIFVFLLLAVAIGFYNGYKKNVMLDAEILVFGVLIAIICLCCLWGFFINKKQLPFFNKPTPESIILSVIVALAWFYISPIINDLLPYESKSSDKRTDLPLLFESLLSLSFAVLQIGVIGHGLLKNYQFGKVLFTVAAMSIIFVVPQAVVGMALQTLLMFYVYYRTASFQLPVLMSLVISILEEFFRRVLKINISYNNFIKSLIDNTTVYYLGLVLCVALIAMCFFYIKKRTQVIAWQRPDEDESMAFL